MQEGSDTHQWTTSVTPMSFYLFRNLPLDLKHLEGGK